MSDTDFGGLTEGLAIRFWGKPTTKTAKELRWGSGGSRKFDFASQTWFDHEAGVGGGAIDLVMREASTDRQGALEWMRKEGLIEARHVASASQQRQEAPPVDNEPAQQESLPVDAPQAVKKPIKGYDYTDADGNKLYQVVRFHFQLPDGSWQIDPKTGNPKKTFGQRRPDGKGGFIWNLDGVGHTIYRHPQVEMAIEAGWTIALCEGEKDVETLEAFDAVATTNSGGAKHWTPEMAAILKGADVVIMVDNDDAGREGAEMKARSLRGIARRIRMLDLAQHVPNFPPKWDVTDWVTQMGGTAEQLSAIIGQLPDWKPRPPASKFGAQRTIDRANKPIVYDWLIKHLVERNGVLILAGESQAGKSFFVMDMGMKIARGLEYGGRKTRQGLVIHMAAEDGRGTELRAEGYRKANGISPDEDVPYLVMDPHAKGAQGFSLMSDESVDAFIAECLQWKAYYGSLELITIDTVSAGAEGLDENSSAEVTKMLTRVNRIRDMTGATVCLVHHMNAAATRIRGSSALVANVANVIEVRPMMTIPRRKDEKPEIIKDSDGRPMRRAILTKNKNGLNDVKWTFVLQEVVVGLDQDGEEQTTCICAKASRQQPEREERQKLSDDQKLVFDALQAAIDTSGQDMPHGTMAGPQIKRCAPQTAFVSCVRKTMTFKAGEDEVEARNSEITAFLKRTTTTLINGGYMGRDNDLKIVWATGKSDRPRQRYQEEERPQERPGAGIPADVLAELKNDPVPF